MIATFIALILIVFMIVSIRKRRFLIGIICGLLMLCASFIALLQLLLKIADQENTAEVLVLLCVYGFIPLIFILFCGRLIYLNPFSLWWERVLWRLFKHGCDYEFKSSKLSCERN